MKVYFFKRLVVIQLIIRPLLYVGIIKLTLTLHLSLQPRLEGSNIQRWSQAATDMKASLS